MNTQPAETNPIDLTLELRSANGSTTEFYQADEERVRETLRLLAEPRLFAQRHLLLASQHCASMIPCKWIDMILVRTFAQTPLKFPLNLPVGLINIVEQPEAWPDNKSAAIEDQNGQPQRRNAQVKIHTLGGWTVTLKATAMISGSVQDERHFFRICLIHRPFPSSWRKAASASSIPPISCVQAHGPNPKHSLESSCHSY